MKKQIALFSLVTAALLAMPAISRAQDTTTNPPAAAAPAAKKHALLPFHGKVSAVDATAGTITVGKLTINVTADTKVTKVTKDGKPATLADFAAGELAAGAYKKDGEKLNATVLHNGKADKAGKKKKTE
jgi:hypothetical protein